MKYNIFFVLSLFIVINVYSQRLADLEGDIVDSTDTDIKRYNQDNKIYKSNKEFVFDYIIVKNNDSLKCQFTKQPYGIPQWQLVKPDNEHIFTVNTVGIAVLPYYQNNTQTGIKFNYYNKAQKIVDNSEVTGLVENDKNIWTHPPRHQFFAITEFNSFPFIKTPYKVGTKWKSGLTAGYFASYERFDLKWEGILETKEDLEIIDKVDLPTVFGTLPCFVVKGICKSRLTESTSFFYFNEEYGFVKIVYDLFDKIRQFVDKFVLWQRKRHILIPFFCPQFRATTSQHNILFAIDRIRRRRCKSGGGQ
jgi:hypothetical protein